MRLKMVVLPAPFWSDEGGDLVFAQDKIDAVDGVDATEVLCQILNPDDVQVRLNRLVGTPPARRYSAL